MVPLIRSGISVIWNLCIEGRVRTSEGERAEERRQSKKEAETETERGERQETGWERRGGEGRQELRLLCLQEWSAGPGIGEVHATVRARE